MIAKIHNISEFARVIRYVVGKTKTSDFFGQNVKQSASERIGGWINSKAISGMIKEFGIIPNKLKHPGKHLSLSLPIGDSVSNKIWHKIAKDVMEASGYGNAQWVCYKHTDTEHEHVHIIANRKDFNLKTVSDSNEKYRFMEVMRTIEAKYNLTPFIEDKTKVKESTLEVRLGRKGVTTDKKELHFKINKAINRSENVSDFSIQLKIEGVEWDPRVNSEGVETGARYTYKGKTYAGSKVGFSLQRIEEFFFEQQHVNEEKIKVLKEKGVLTFMDFVSLLVLEKSTGPLDFILSKKGSSKKDVKFVEDLFERFKDTRIENETLRKAILESFDKHNIALNVKIKKLIEQRKRKEFKHRVDIVLLERPCDTGKYIRLLEESKSLNLEKYTIQRAVGIGDEGYIPFFHGVMKGAIGDFLTKEQEVNFLDPVASGAREYYQKRRENCREEPLSDAGPEVISNHILALSKGNNWNNRSIGLVLESYKPENIMKADFRALDEQKLDKLKSRINIELGGISGRGI